MKLELFQCDICPLSRMVTMLLHELKIQFAPHNNFFWRVDQAVLSINPLGTRPTLLCSDTRAVFIGGPSIIECIEQSYPDKDEAGFILFGGRSLSKKHRYHYDSPTTPPPPATALVIDEKTQHRGYVRQLCDWFNTRLYYEVVKPIIHEKISKTIENSQEPTNSQEIRKSREALTKHLSYIDYLLSLRQLYLTGDEPTLADYAAAAQISTLDMMQEIIWSKHPRIKQWYSLLKSRPSMQQILTANLPAAIRSPAWYADPDSF